MWSSRVLLSLSVFVFVPTCMAQIRNSTLAMLGIDDLDYYDPEIYNFTDTRIVGGRPISINRVPWQLALYDGGYFICGASIISRDWVLTAAHCVEGGGNFAVRAGSTYVNRGGQIRYANAVIIHSRYNSRTFNYDIALLRVRQSFRITPNVRPIPLAKRNRSLPDRFFVSGWGRTRENGQTSNRLRGVTIAKITRPRCQRQYAPVGIGITVNMICATSPQKDACQGDSGGPLVNGRIQYGIVSYGIGCARPNYPGVYTNLRRLNQWVRSVINLRGGAMPTFKAIKQKKKAI
ncbi:trypsin alpha-3-like [Stomoxys calcitrans]|uniref:trypsin alpha-3-like n=1 Tax=Stomoxys calcitrans TaxID=35570 RepID=UPI0027E366D4|nr:trypsin alpha-3-like [Stomoxys calcitrans]